MKRKFRNNDVPLIITTENILAPLAVILILLVWARCIYYIFLDEIINALICSVIVLLMQVFILLKIKDDKTNKFIKNIGWWACTIYVIALYFMFPKELSIIWISLNIVFYFAVVSKNYREVKQIIKHRRDVYR